MILQLLIQYPRITKNAQKENFPKLLKNKCMNKKNAF